MRILTKKTFSLWVKPLLWLQKRHFGNILNPAKLWGRKPVLFWLVALFFGYLDRKKSPIDAVMRSLVCVRVSQLNNCAFCVDANGMKLAERCHSLEKIKALAHWQTSEHFSEQEQAVLTYTEAMTLNDQQVSDEMLATLATWYSSDDIIELTALVSFQNLSAKFNTALDVPAQGFCSLPIQPQTQQNTVPTTSTADEEQLRSHNEK
ncbi:alkylhydroperoxidase [Photobacterium iliopiscarium]|uniref:Carboxymuconolactone decarboxylase family protein n=1 Tax=Photobacterium iliopiscarium TaxID=56192 RepID=A0ABX5GV82_9GAMM|nr:carboxymuconolactone decarboxylase family protein [Photobacterium iliopiscarium]KJG22515.1 alkylhydroperoxidase [Photobacterium iliopiscarium]MCD9466487.1 carboxymuconolactone decarboxylase family protein [Photobacterium iliopiscarium]MCD9486147.1 carboxymuconolactone decarboxylase family protein [Photobacterium iliopiscarium]MCF2243810.1 carboxymuconolactone decarboxylase family protein [Photobacterium iliopiscarium]PST91451.1 carboxymuconolactone decarboxylase family protein [Photobacteri